MVDYESKDPTEQMLDEEIDRKIQNGAEYSDPDVAALIEIRELAWPEFKVKAKHLESKSVDVQKYLDALAEIEAWKDASGLVDGRGDPDGITPDAARRWWNEIEDRMTAAEGKLTEYQSKDLEVYIAFDRTGKEIVRDVDGHVRSWPTIDAALDFARRDGNRVAIRVPLPIGTECRSADTRREREDDGARSKTGRADLHLSNAGAPAQRGDGDRSRGARGSASDAVAANQADRPEMESLTRLSSRVHTVDAVIVCRDRIFTLPVYTGATSLTFEGRTSTRLHTLHTAHGPIAIFVEDDEPEGSP
jgi:hypothetical protein